jgi:hypothetical protein
LRWRAPVSTARGVAGAARMTRRRRARPPASPNGSRRARGRSRGTREAERRTSGA